MGQQDGKKPPVVIVDPDFDDDDDDFTDEQLSQVIIPDDAVNSNPPGSGSVDNDNSRSAGGNPRFAAATSETIDELRSFKDSKKTIKNTAWGCGVLEGKTTYILHLTQTQICHFHFFAS